MSTFDRQETKVPAVAARPENEKVAPVDIADTYGTLPQRSFSPLISVS